MPGALHRLPASGRRAATGRSNRDEFRPSAGINGIGGWLSGIRGIATALLLVACAPAALADDKPLEIGVLALGPRNVPVWSCGPANQQEGNARPKRETMPFYVLGMLEELDKLGYVEVRPDKKSVSGRRFNLDLRMGTSAELRTFAREFAGKPVDIIVAVAAVGVRIAQEETRNHPIPILFPGISDPVGDGFVQSLAHPGGFITGVSHQEVQGSGKRLELFKEMLPRLQRLITIRMPGYGPAEKSLADIKATADRLKIDVLDWTASNRDELKTVLSGLRHDTADGIMILADSFVISNLDLIIPAGLAQGIPTFGLQDFMPAWGALGSYGPSAYQAGGRVARYVDKIVKGANPGDLPVEPIDPTLVVNLKVAKCLGITMPLEVLHLADRVIQ
jgi:putative ABC transport system substrate-binding protein